MPEAYPETGSVDQKRKIGGGRKEVNILPSKEIYYCMGCKQ